MAERVNIVVKAAQTGRFPRPKHVCLDGRERVVAAALGAAFGVMKAANAGGIAEGIPIALAIDYYSLSVRPRIERKRRAQVRDLVSDAIVVNADTISKAGISGTTRVCLSERHPELMRNRGQWGKNPEHPSALQKAVRVVAGKIRRS